MNRRDFLRPQQLLRTSGHITGAVDEARRALESAVPTPPPPEAALLRFSRTAMATTFELFLPFDAPNALQAAEEALDEIDRLEGQLTVYRDSSEVSHINQGAAARPIRVEDRLFELFQLAQRLHRDSAGAFDISVGRLIKAWGFYRRRGQVPAENELAEVRTRIGMQNVRLDSETKTIAFLRPGLEINLGSIGKGYALDRVAEHLVQRWQLRHALLHGGRSSVYALGGQPGAKRGWLVDIRHPEVPDRKLAELWLRDRAMGTSAATFQHLHHEGRKLGHILDPRTCWPAEGMHSATATAPTAAEADALATVFFIVGVDRARQYCAAHPDIGAVLLPEGAERPVVLGHAEKEL